ncbi:phosphoribosylglycinamide formyltransferase [Mycobacterium antarcticum]|uniref:MmcQ/YjbR family DNA-binding protein n=1 Tax=unclassified Mycolicibacterium TaxID=2636767 RepID=UPI0023A226AF|nr:MULTISPECIES: MmcQ/YjbR family DNA-binding protein [unclassified Mycolicibacterium]BDX33223.1 phosphoribosylglycinamide formyltransferase [Mycolicibacterium sp. TUM20985]GLP83223.1 phosphoribosylglycinamide formyltransferase [Mycolicibacterium sp. TUM20984]
MPHPIMFREDDPGLAEVRAIALAYPEAYEKVSHGRPGFFVSKMFAMYGGSSKETGRMTAVPHCLLVKVDDSDRVALAQDRRFFRPAYLGPSGWLGLDFTAADVDWDEVRELIDASFRLVAPARLIKALGANRQQ